MPHQLRAWAVSALVAAVLVAVLSWRMPPDSAAGWALAAGAWAVGAVVLHLLLHNRWMHELDARWRARLSARRRARVPRPTRPAQPVRTRRGAGHATHRGVRLPWPPADAATQEEGGRYDRRGRPARRQPR